MDEITQKQMPAVALRGLTVFPDMIIHFDLSRKKSIMAVEEAMSSEQKVFLVTQKNPDTEDPKIQDVYEVGTVAAIKQINKLPNGILRVLVEGLFRAQLQSMTDENGYLQVQADEMVLDEHEIEPITETAMVREIYDLFLGYGRFYPKIGKALELQLKGVSDLAKVIDCIAMGMPLRSEMKQKVLQASTLQERYDCLSAILYNEIEIGKIKSDLTQKVKGRVEKHQKEYLLREQLSFIQEELGENDSFSDADQFTEALGKLKAGKEVKDRIRKEIARFKSFASNSSESSVERAYIETLLELPWDKVSRDNTDIERAERILNEQHYGLEKVKERILEFLAVRTLTKRGDSPIVCLVGPPGTGKTSIAKSVAEALNKKYIRICLGGVRDEAEIRGHRRTYVGAMPGRIVSGLKQAGVKNPLILLDEIDKVSSDYKGDTSSALLEVLDGEQNSRFRDHYIEIPVDLSEVLFLATANSVADIPRPLLDRMELIEVSSYTENEKFHIAKEHLLAKQLVKNGLSDRQLQISDSALKNMISRYTREAGVRDLERKIGQVCRKAAKEILLRRKKEKAETVIRVTAQNLTRYLGREKYFPDKINDTDEVGIVRGLAWTSVGGVTLQIEVNMMPGKGEVELTGQMGDVMKESALTGMSYIRSISKEYQISPEVFKKNDFHIHIPEGAVPKDGPSAGITMATALLSTLTKIPVYADVAMTGEITLRGRVLPIGGLKEKLLAAKTAGIRKVLVPSRNEKEVEDISGEIKNGMEIVFVDTMSDVLKHALKK